MTARFQAPDYAALYAPTCEELCRTLPEVAEAVQTQLIELSVRPCIERCDQLSATLAGALTTIRKLREALIREGV